MVLPTDQDRYREYWAYLRHIETVRFALAGLIVTVANALLAVVLVNPDNGLNELQRALALVFLSLFVGFSAWFLGDRRRGVLARVRVRDCRRRRAGTNHLPLLWARLQMRLMSTP